MAMADEKLESAVGKGRMESSGRVVLTIDMGVGSTKVALWRGLQLVALNRASLITTHPRPGWAEQDPSTWWTSIVDAIGQFNPAAQKVLKEVEAIGFATAGETLVLVDKNIEPVGPGYIWSDRRGDAIAKRLEYKVGGIEPYRQRTGVALDSGTPLAKVSWLSEMQPEKLSAARWILSPRELVIHKLTGRVVTDKTVASRSGFFDLTGAPIEEVADLAANRFPKAVNSFEIIGELGSIASTLGLPQGIPIVIGAADRSCNALGSGARADVPMVLWGTNAHVLAPVVDLPATLPDDMSVMVAPLGGYLYEVALSASGETVMWLADLTRLAPEALYEAAASSRPGANGVVALPWLNGARAPWFDPRARASFLGISPGHGPGDLARAVVDAVALDVARSFEVIAPGATSLTCSGRGATSALWRSILAATTSRSVLSRRHDESASVGVRLIVAQGLGERVVVDTLNPITNTCEPEPGAVETYRYVRSATDAAANAVLSLSEILDADAPAPSSRPLGEALQQWRERWASRFQDRREGWRSRTSLGE